MNAMIDASQTLRHSAHALSARAATILDDMGRPTIDEVAFNHEPSYKFGHHLLRADVSRSTHQAPLLRSLMADATSWEIEAATTLRSMVDGSRTGSLLNSSAASMLHDTVVYRTLSGELHGVSPIQHDNSALEALAAAIPSSGDSHAPQYISGVLVSIHPREPAGPWPSGASALAYARSHGDTMDIQHTRPLTPFTRTATQATVLDRIARLEGVHAAEDGARALVEGIAGTRLTATPTGHVDATALGGLAEQLNAADSHLSSAQFAMRSLVDSSMIVDGARVLARSDLYAEGVGTTLAELTGARDAYRTAADVLAAASNNGAHADKLRAAATTIDDVATRFGNAHASAARSLLAATDDQYTVVKGPWAANAAEFAALYPTGELARGSVTRRVKLDESFASARTFDNQLGQQLDLVLDDLGGHGLVGARSARGMYDDHAFEQLAAAVRATVAPDR